MIFCSIMNEIVSVVNYLFMLGVYVYDYKIKLLENCFLSIYYLNIW